jgi:hypothetical protein
VATLKFKIATSPPLRPLGPNPVLCEEREQVLKDPVCRTGIDNRVYPENTRRGSELEILAMPNSHRAYATLDGRQVEGYTVHVTEASADHVNGELRNLSKRTQLNSVTPTDVDKMHQRTPLVLFS